MNIRLAGLQFLLAGAAVAFIPAVYGQSTPSVRPTGSLEVLSGPAACDGQSCYEVAVTCPEVQGTARANLVVASHSGSSANGTVIFTTGGLGDGLYESNGLSESIIESSRNAGFQTVQLQWIDSWLVASPGDRAGQARLACRPATVAKWVYENLASTDSSQAFCATGHSGGAAQNGFMLSHYGLKDVIDAVVLSGGPPMTRIDLSCDRNNPDNPYAAPDFGANITDLAFGYRGNEDQNNLPLMLRTNSGPCTNADSSFTDSFVDAGLVSYLGDYFYPNTMVSFVFEEIDDTGAVALAGFFREAMEDVGSTLIDAVTVPGVSHAGPGGLYASAEGVGQVSESLLESCKVWR